jgi:hypothetical protein
MPITKPRNRVVLFRLTQDEYESLQAACSADQARSISDYARARILGQNGGQTGANGESLAQVEAQLAEIRNAVERLQSKLGA